MIPIRTLASTMLAAFGAASNLAGGHAARHTRLEGNDATVVALSVVPTTGRADVVIRVDGPIALKHFTLDHPDKIVVDLTGATLGLPAGDAYDGVARGGITRIRYSQFTKTIVRIVLTLDALHPYEVTQGKGEVHVSVAGNKEQFDSWKVGSDAAAKAAAATPLAAVQPDRETAAVPAVQSASRPQSRPEAPSPTFVRNMQAAAEKAAVDSRTTIFHPNVQQQALPVSVNWENTPINDVIALLAAYSGRTILATRNVTGTVTASFNNQPWDVVLKEVMNANGYDVTVNPDGVIVVDTFDAIAARQATVPLTNRIIRLNYARAFNIAPMVRERLTRTCPTNTVAAAAAAAAQQSAAANAGAPTAPGAPPAGGITSLQCPTRGAVTADTVTNSISITDIPSNMAELEAYTRSLDIRQPQVNIRAKIVLVDRTTIEGLGLRYDIGTPEQFFNDIIPRTDSTGRPLTTPGQILLGGNTLSAIADAQQRVPSAALQLVFSTAMGNYSFSSFLEALQQNVLLDVQAEPSATVLNNRTANMMAGTQVPIRIIDIASGSNNTGNFPRSTVSFQQTGIILTVTPQITNNRQVQMKIHAENSDVQFQSNDVGAVFPKQSYDGEMLVADGQTAVVGGLTQTNVNVNKTGIPLLVDLPIIGRLFGVTNRTETKRDLLILITPHIVDDGQQPDSGRP